MTAPKLPKATKGEILAKVAERTGLSRACVKELLKDGWTYGRSPSGNAMHFYKPIPPVVVNDG